MMSQRLITRHDDNGVRMSLCGWLWPGENVSYYNNITLPLARLKLNDEYQSSKSDCGSLQNFLPGQDLTVSQRGDDQVQDVGQFQVLDQLVLAPSKLSLSLSSVCISDVPS